MELVGKVFESKDGKVTARVVRAEGDDVYLVNAINGLKGIVTKERLYELYNEKAESEEIKGDKEPEKQPEDDDAQDAPEDAKATTKTTTKRGNK